jgi:hypothetical protein
MAGLSRTSRRLLVAVALSAITALALAAPAGAWLRDFQSTQVLTPANSTSPKSLQFVCPAQKSAIGAGATIPFVSNLALNKIWVLFGQRAALTAAAETDTDAASWALTTRAWCTTQTAVRPTLATGAAYVKNVTIERNQSSSNSNSPKFVEARCPAGTNSIGGGLQIEGGNNQVAAESVQRLATGLRARAHETDATGAAWAVEAHAICANVSTAVTTATYAGGSGPIPVNLTGPEGTTGLNSLNKTVTATCGAGRSVVGGGAVVRGAAAGESPAPAKVAITVSRPAGDGTSSNQWTASAVEVDPTGAAWRLTARAVCTTLNGSPAP